MLDPVRWKKRQRNSVDDLMAIEQSFNVHLYCISFNILIKQVPKSYFSQFRFWKTFKAIVELREMH